MMVPMVTALTGNRDNPGAVRHHDMLAPTPNVESGFLQGTDSIEVVDAWKLGHDYTLTSTSRSSPSSSAANSAATSRYSRMAWAMFSSASSSVVPCEQHPGRPGT